MKVQELLQALHSIGEVYRSRDQTKPAASIVSLVKLFEGSHDLTIEEWTAKQKSKQLLGHEKLPSKPEPNFKAILNELEKLADQPTSQELMREFDKVNLTAPEWIELAKLISGRKARSGKAAKDQVRNHLINQVQLHNRSVDIERTFP